MNLHRHDLFVTAVIIAAGWLGRRAWLKAKKRYQGGSCCGEGCGCAAPVVFGPKKKKPLPKKG